MHVLPRGGVIDLPRTQDGPGCWSVAASWGHQTTCEIDVVAFTVDGDEQVSCDEDFVFYGAPESPDGTVRLVTDGPTEQAITVDLAEVARDLKPVYTAPTEDAALERLADFADRWDAKYPAISGLWQRNWEAFTPFLRFPHPIREVIYTTNAIESLNARYRRAVGACGHFLNETAALKRLYLATLADVNLGADPLTGNRYAFAGGNPISNVELDGHESCYPHYCSGTNGTYGTYDSKKDPEATARYREGAPEEPKVSYHDSFPYDPNAHASLQDYLSWTKWEGMDAGAFWASITGYRNLEDAELTYRHYRDGTGLDFDVDYEKAYRDDSHIRAAVNKEIAVAQAWAERIHSMNGKDEFSITGAPVNVGGAYYPATENWAKAIGEHKIWGSADIKIDGNKVIMNVVMHEKDRYDFNKGMHDIASGTPDDVNGRFAVLGWAKPFMAYGTVRRTVTWTLGDITGSTSMSGSGGR